MKFEKAVVLRISKEIELELASIRKLLDEYGDLPEFESSSIECRVKGSILHDFYSGMERIFRRIAEELNGGVPNSEQWHRDLLDEMTWEFEGIRPPVIGEDLRDRLSVLLRFRHVFRNMYGFALDADKLHETAEDFAAVAESSIAQIEKFLAWLASEAR